MVIVNKCLCQNIFVYLFLVILFLLFSAINKGDTKDTEMELIMDNIVESLFSVFVTLGKVLFIADYKIIGNEWGFGDVGNHYVIYHSRQCTHN